MPPSFSAALMTSSRALLAIAGATPASDSDPAAAKPLTNWRRSLVGVIVRSSLLRLLSWQRFHLVLSALEHAREFLLEIIEFVGLCDLVLRLEERHLLAFDELGGFGLRNPVISPAGSLLKDDRTRARIEP